MTTNEYLLIVAGVLAVVLILVQVGRRALKKRTGQGRDSYIEALRHMVSGESDLAYSRLVETVRDDTSNIDAYILLGDILRRRGNLERALKVHRDVTIRTDLSKSTHLAVLRSLTLDYMAAHRWGAAERTLNELDKMARGDRWARLRLLEVYESQNDWGSAYELGRHIAGEPEVDGARLARYKVEQAAGLVEEEDYHRARILLKDALKHDAQYADSYLMIGDTYAAEGRTEDAIEWWERLVDTVPGRAADAFKRLEDSLYELGSFDQIADIYARHLEANPGSADAALAMSGLLERKGDHRAAIDLLQRHRGRCDDPVQIDRALVLLYHQTGSTEKAMTLALKVAREVVAAERTPVREVPGPSIDAPAWLDSGGTWDPTLGDEENSTG